MLAGAVFGSVLGAIPGLAFGFYGSFSGIGVSAGIIGTLVVGIFAAVAVALPGMLFGALVGGMIAIDFTLAEPLLNWLERIGPPALRLGPDSTQSDINTILPAAWPVWVIVAGTGSGMIRLWRVGDE